MDKKPQQVSLPAAQLTLPGGFTVKVCYKTGKQLKHLAKEDVFGYWQQAARGGRIVINRDSPQWRQIKTFGHELVHAIHDYAHWLDRMAEVIEQEARETALALREDD